MISLFQVFMAIGLQYQKYNIFGHMSFYNLKYTIHIYIP